MFLAALSLFHFVHCKPGPDNNEHKKKEWSNLVHSFGSYARTYISLTASSHYHHHLSLYTVHCWVLASSQYERPWSIVPTQAQYVLGTSTQFITSQGVSQCFPLTQSSWLISNVISLNLEKHRGEDRNLKGQNH